VALTKVSLVVEKKRNELMQMLLLQQSYCILNETRISGLDIECLQVPLQDGVNSQRSADRSFIVCHALSASLDYIS